MSDRSTLAEVDATLAAFPRGPLCKDPKPEPIQPTLRLPQLPAGDPDV